MENYFGVVFGWINFLGFLRLKLVVLMDDCCKRCPPMTKQGACPQNQTHLRLLFSDRCPNKYSCHRPARLILLLPSTSSSSRHRRQCHVLNSLQVIWLAFWIVVCWSYLHALPPKCSSDIAQSSLDHLLPKQTFMDIEDLVGKLEVRRYNLGDLAIFDHPPNHLLSLTWLHWLHDPREYRQSEHRSLGGRTCGKPDCTI